jgi:hypothetical protein
MLSDFVLSVTIPMRSMSPLVTSFSIKQQGSGDFEAGPAWPHTHTLQNESDKCFIKVNDKLYAISTVTITGSLQWRKRKRIPDFYIIENVQGHEAFAGAAVADYGSDDGKMFAMIFPSKSRTLGIHQFQLNEKQRNIIRKLKIPL